MIATETQVIVFFVVVGVVVVAFVAGVVAIAVALGRRLARGAIWWTEYLRSGREAANERLWREVNKRRTAGWSPAESAWEQWCFEHPGVDRANPDAKAWFMQAWNAHWYGQQGMGPGA